jgi:hypothetical protein
LSPDGPHLVLGGLDLVELGVLLHEAVDLGVRRLLDPGDEIADAVAVDRVPELPLGGDLVALGDRHLAHVVPEARELEALAVGPSARRPHPDAYGLVDAVFLPMADDDLPVLPQPGADVPELPVAVGGLVQVHEVHVDRAPGQVTVELGVEVGVGLAQRGEAGDPHLRGREGVHPEDEADAGRGRVRLGEEPEHLLRRLDDGLEHDAARDARRAVERLRDGLGVGGDLGERLGPVQVLGAGHEPHFGLLEVGDQGDLRKDRDDTPSRGRIPRTASGFRRAGGPAAGARARGILAPKRKPCEKLLNNWTQARSPPSFQGRRNAKEA